MKNIRQSSQSIVPTTVNYTSSLLYANLSSLQKSYPFLSSGNIGKSVLGKDIPYVRLGNGPKEVFYNASFHANEWITSTLLMKFIENFCISYVKDGFLYGYRTRQLFHSASLYLVPMVNPDGVDIVTDPSSNNIAFSRAKAIANQYPSIPFPYGWKANMNGVTFTNSQPI